MKGRLHSFQSFSTSDGPGVRCVVFLQGCPLRCMYCHNPDTWEFDGGMDIEVNQLMEKIRRCRPYFGAEGGVTISGGEVLAQAGFASEILRQCQAEGIHTCIETSGSILTDDVREMLRYVDLVYLDVKMVNETDYAAYVGTSLAKVLSFLSYLETIQMKTIIRQVILEDFNDSQHHMRTLKSLLGMYTVIDHVEFLPFHKLGSQKYQELGLVDRSKDFKPTSLETIAQCEAWYQEA